VLVLVSFVLVLAAAVTLVVGLLQSGLTLIYLSIGCSVLAGVVLAVAVLRGRPEPKAAAPVGRPFTPPVSAPPVPASVGAPNADPYPTTSFTPSPPAAPAPPLPAPAASRDDLATKAAGNALLGRLRGRKAEEQPVAAAPAPGTAAEREPEPEPELDPATMQMPVMSPEADDGFPISDYDQLRATDLLRRLGPLDRNQLEAVRQRETAGKNRFTILSRVDVLLAAQAEPEWEVADDEEWEAEAGPTIIEVGPVDEDGEFDDFIDGEMEDDEADEVDVDETYDVDVDEVDELVSPTDDFPIAGYDSLTVGQILPRLSDLDADELAEIRDRELQGRARGTILDRVDRLASKSGAGAVAMPAAAPARKAPVRRARVAPAAAIPVPPATTTTPMKEAVKKAAARKAAAATGAPARRSAGRKVVAPVVPADPVAPTREAVKKASARKAATAGAAAAATTPVRRKAAPPVVPSATPMNEAVKKARATKASKATKRP